MSTEGRTQPHDDPRLTAYALGELEGAERAEIEALLEHDAAARRAVEAIRATAGRLSAALGGGATAELGDARRERILSRARSASAGGSGARVPPRPARARRVWTIAAIAAAAVFATTIGYGVFVGRSAETGGAAPFQYALFGDPVARAPAGAPSPHGARRALDYDDGAEGESPESQYFLAATAERKDPHRELDELGYLGEDERFTSESYDRIVENPFVPVAVDPRSTFSIDVDTASYANVRRFLRSDRLPPPDAVRIEELVNYFRYDDPLPGPERPFSVAMEVASAPWKPEHRLVRIGLRGREISFGARQPSNLVFLIDVSGSMEAENKLPLLVRSMRLLVDQLDERDRVAIVVYAGSSGLSLPSTSCAEKATILAAFERLSAGGSTNGGEGIELAYRIAREGFVEGGINRVILATDGDFNVGISDRGSLSRLIEEKARSGVFLSVLGFGSGNLQDDDLEQLADEGNGNYAYVDSLQEARKVLVEEMGGTLVTIAKDVKLQLELNPARVQAFRLIGYENRVLDHQDFTDDTKDAGEIGAGHTVTALYELVPVGVPFEGTAVDPLKYQRPGELSADAHSTELLTVKLRWKAPEASTSRGMAVPLHDSGATFEAASEDLRFAASVAAFGMLLRGSEHAGSADWDLVFDLARSGLGPDRGGYRTEFLELVQRARRLAQEGDR